MNTITTRRNGLVGQFRDAARGEDDAIVLLDGAHLVGDAVAAGLHIHQVVVSTDASARPEIRGILAALAGRGVEVSAATSMVMDAVSPVRSASGIVALAARPPMAAERVYVPAPPLVVVAV